ncbi:MAG: NAD(P)H-dependent oxidoreductase subunit E [Candidatus Bathyarchaeota archaeon]|nr:NAD(P)H-dependent oxidoreductase subunit E [Candidatus Bathyarchaeota archaeon]
MRPDKAKLANLETITELEKQIEQSAELKEIINDYCNSPGSLIMTMNRIQDLFGYIPKSALRILSSAIRIPLSELMSIVSFYHFFSTFPKGRYTIKVCMGTSCYVRGGEKIIKRLKKELNLEPGMTSDDDKFSLEVVRCLGCCGLSPVIAIDDEVYTRVTSKKMKGLLGDYA